MVEGQSDRATLPILARRLLQPGIGIDARLVAQGDMLSARKVEAHIKAAINQQQDTNKVLICIDSECTEVDVTGTRIDHVARTVAENLHGLAIKGVVVDHSLEGWLLHDREALAGFLNISVTANTYRNPESDCRPATTMGKLFRRARKDFVKTAVLPPLAERADLDKVAQASPTFVAFRSAILEN